MKVEIWFDRSSVPIVYQQANSTYQKGDLFCIGYDTPEGPVVDKYPVDHLFKVRETQFTSSQPAQEITFNFQEWPTSKVLESIEHDITGHGYHSLV